MKLLEYLVSVLTFPVCWFWKRFETYKQSGNIAKIALLFAVSLSGVVVIGISLFKLANYLFTYHLNLLLIIACIPWLYSYFRDKSNKANVKPDSTPPSDVAIQAEKGYPIMRSIIYQTAKSVAPDIGAKLPRLLGEVEVPDQHYIISNNICFYQFNLMKADPKVQYSPEELSAFKAFFQTELTHKIHSGDFPALQLEVYRDKYGNFYDSVILESLEDIGNMLILQSVFISPDYAEYRHQLHMMEHPSTSATQNIEESWDDH